MYMYIHEHMYMYLPLGAVLVLLILLSKTVTWERSSTIPKEFRLVEHSRPSILRRTFLVDKDFEDFVEERSILSAERIFSSKLSPECSSDAEEHSGSWSSISST